MSTIATEPTERAATAARAAPAPALPASIRAGLDGLKRRLLLVSAGTGLVYLVAGGLAYHLGSFILDRTLDLPRPFRAVLLGLAALGLIALALRSLLRPSARAARLSDDDAALLAEGRFGLDQGLISAVQLARPNDRQEVRSAQLVQVVIDDAARRVAGLDLAGAVATGGLVRVLAATVAIVLVVFALARRDPVSARIWWERNVLLLETSWPREVDIAFEHEPARGVVALGDAVTVKARVLRGAPKRVIVRVDYPKSGETAEIAAVRQKDGVYRVEIENLPEPIRFRVEGGDFKGPWVAIDVRQRPKLADIALWVTHPPYTGIEDTPADEPLADGNLKLPAGSVVRFTAEATETLASATLEHDIRGALTGESGAPLDGALALEVSGRRLRGGFTVAASTRYGIQLASADGFASGGAAQFTITAVADRLPEVRIDKPGRNKDATPTAVVPLEVTLRDDYRLVEAALVYRVRKSGETQPGAEVRVPLALEGPEREAAAQATVVEARLELAGLGVAPDDSVEYWAEAIDARAQGALAAAKPEERGRTRSSFYVKVVSPADLERALQARLKRLRDDLQQLERTQAGLRGEVEQAGAGLARGAGLEAADRRKLTYAELDQRKVGQRLERALAELGAVREEMELNKLTKDEDAGWLAEIEAITAQTLRGPVAEAAGLLGALRQAEAPEAVTLTRALRLQDEVIEVLRDLVRRLDKWDLFNDVVRDFRDLRRLQEKIRELTRRRMQAGSESGSGTER